MIYAPVTDDEVEKIVLAAKMRDAIAFMTMRRGASVLLTSRSLCTASGVPDCAKLEQLPSE
jgi:hypothetical protein